MKSAIIADYGVGNLFGVCRALSFVGAEPIVTHDPDTIQKAEWLILPGVGAFAHGMNGLRERGLDKPILEFARSGKPVLGICLGMQLLFEESQEFGEHRGLGLIRGRVVEIPDTDEAGHPHRIPHIGWTSLAVPSRRDDWSDSILDGTKPGAAVYFVHSYVAIPANEEDWLAEADYNGRRICAAVKHGNITGCQFHPEKSGAVGLKIIRQFIEHG